MDLLAGLWATGDTAKVAEGVLAADSLIWKEHGDLNRIPGLYSHGDRFPQPDTGKGVCSQPSRAYCNK